MVGFEVVLGVAVVVVVVVDAAAAVVVFRWSNCGCSKETLYKLWVPHSLPDCNTDTIRCQLTFYGNRGHLGQISSDRVLLT